METVRSRRNPRVSAASRLRRSKERVRTGNTLIEGPNLLAEALDAEISIVEAFALEDDLATRFAADQHRFRLTTVTPDVLASVADTESPRGPIAVIQIPHESSSPKESDFLELHVTDPGNAGTLMRTAAAFAMGVVVSTGAVDPWSPKTIRAGAGAHFRTSLYRSRPIDVGLIATIPRGGVSAITLAAHLDRSRRWMVMIGSEAHGLDPEAIREADVRVSIDMPGNTESLNAAAAGAIVGFQLANWRYAEYGRH